MVAVIVGGGPMLDALKQAIPEKRWKVPAGSDERAQIRFLADHPAPRGKGLVFTNVSGNWLSVSDSGWRIMWCDDSQPPLGATALPEQTLERSMSDLARRFWGTDLADRRLVGDLILGDEHESAVLLTVTSFSGGVGKTLTCRRLCERAAAMGIATLLIDGNMLQSSQRSFFDPAKTAGVRTIANWRPGMKPQAGANQGKRFGVGYDICFAPPTGMTVSWERYAQYIQRARRLWSLIVLDLDRISAVDLQDDTTAAGALLTPSILSGDPTLFIVKTGRQTQADAMSVLSVMPSLGFPREAVGIKDTIPVDGDDDYQPVDYRNYGTFLGTEHQSREAGEQAAAGKSGWADPGLDLVRERVLKWAMPDEDFDPTLFEPKEGLIETLFGRKKKKKQKNDDKPSRNAKRKDRPNRRRRDDEDDEPEEKPRRKTRKPKRRRDDDYDEDDYENDDPDDETEDDEDDDYDEQPRRRRDRDMGRDRRRTHRDDR